MKRRSSSLKKHTESNRVMRGAWKTDCEYILELHTEREVGCDVRHTLPCREISGVLLDQEMSC